MVYAKSKSMQPPKHQSREVVVASVLNVKASVVLQR
jgi:hypothetical protein